MKTQIKVLIFFRKNDIGHFGGPSGYLIPFLKNQSSFSNIELSFLPSDNDKSTNRDTNLLPSTVNKRKTKRFKILLFRLLSSFLNKQRLTQYSRMKDASIKHVPIKDFTQFDVVVFHTTFQMYECRHLLKDYKGLVYLQSHQPKPAYRWVYEDAVGFKDKLTGLLLKHFYKKADRWAFDRTNYIIFPCKEAEEPFFNKWSYYRKNRVKWNSKFRYLMTVNEPVLASGNIAYDLRKQYNIPKDSIIMLFIGCHIKAKGYDLLKKMGRKYKNRNDIFFVCCGNYQKCKYPKYSNWIEIGFTQDIYSIIVQSDYCLSLNKDTYFDLSVLEHLSLGKTMIIKKTGGNKKIADIFENKVLVFDTSKELKNLLEKIIKGVIAKSNECDVLEIYSNNFSVDLFLKSFEEMIVNDVSFACTK